jgi:hypothetical protein
MGIGVGFVDLLVRLKAAGYIPNRAVVCDNEKLAKRYWSVLKPL